MSKNSLFLNGEENDVTRNPHADPDHYQKSVSSRGLLLSLACQVWSMSVYAFVSDPVHRMTDRTTERSHNIGGGIKSTDATLHIHNAWFPSVRMYSVTQSNAPQAFAVRQKRREKSR